jgi:hypothetical protein
LTAAAHLERERADLLQLWQQRQERAAYEVERAARHYRALEPEHRLVARQLAQEWEAKLAAQAQLEEEYHRFVQRQPRGLSEREELAIRRLAADIPALWHAATTTVGERKEILRQVVQQVVVTVQGTSERVLVTITWVGGSQTTGEVARPIAQVEHLSYYAPLCVRLRMLVAAEQSLEAIADCLAAEGYRSPKGQTPFGPRAVHDLAQRLGLRLPRPRRHAPLALGAHEWLVPDLAEQLGMPAGTLYSWIARGQVRARSLALSGGQDRWVIWADAAEVTRLQELLHCSPGSQAHARWTAPDQTAVTPTEYP